MEQLESKVIEVIEGTVEAPLWGKPPLESEQGYASLKEKGAQEDESKDI
jgi:hypothetical protein